ncbi:hypothetical protein EBESD8_57530 [Rhodococcus aetherivorans]|nr:hypothetical protein EBESD8_57530 [Rhodococcus aetherivorans]
MGLHVDGPLCLTVWAAEPARARRIGHRSAYRAGDGGRSRHPRRSVPRRGGERMYRSPP